MARAQVSRTSSARRWIATSNGRAPAVACVAWAAAGAIGAPFIVTTPAPSPIPAVASRKRFSGLPDVPTMDETGMPGFESVLHYGLLAPAGTPRPIIDRLNRELRAAVGAEDVRKRINAEGGDPLTSTPEEYAADIDQEERKWGGLVRKLNLKVE